MSLKDIEAILVRVMNDSIFADALFKDPEKTLAGFDLTAEELAKFKTISRSGLAGPAEWSPEVRRSFSLIGKHPTENGNG